MPRSRISLAIAAFSTCLLGATGCLRQTGAPAGMSEMRRPPPQERAEAPIEETDQPVASFLLNGEPFCFAGTNNYYPIFASHKMVDDLLETTKRLDLKVIRIWAYLDIGSHDLTAPKVDPNSEADGAKGGVYFQFWDPIQKRPAYNDGATGIEHLDYVLDKARKLDLKVMLVLTNNWKDFGGMDQYVVWYGLHEHHQFYTDPQVTKGYKDWVAHLVHRKNSVSGAQYRDDPTIFGWELANEPRCANGGQFDHRSGCTTQMIVHWADEMSAFIKSIDPNHLVSVGDEGFFANGNGFGYDGSDGVDHEGLLALQHVDFGTYHLYPDSWGQRLSWSSQWIEDHIQAARRAGKPTMLEEYGVIARRDATGRIIEADRRSKAYPRWHDLIEKRGGNAALFWMLAAFDDEHGKYPDYDHFALYADDPMMSLITTFASKMATDSQACRLYRKLAPSGAAAKSPFVTVSSPPNRGQAQNASLDIPPSG
jgi:mannan endo-1,4-beta-mannosidase